jgi:lipopolysaccharide/colanic/teichoic acid biosynthesis glycosyltransferase
MAYTLKRSFDIIVTLFSLLVLFIPFIISAICIKLDSKGPIFFKQKRVGKNMKEFTLYKLRTMVQNAHKLQKKYEHLNEAYFPTFKIPNDPRLTKVGKLLRAFHLDEVPNFINVLKGDMSIVGYRPPLKSEVKHYKEWHKERFNGTPGITSLWAVKKYHTCSFDEWVQLDILYEKNSSLLFDISIIIRTIKKMIF